METDPADDFPFFPASQHLRPRLKSQRSRSKNRNGNICSRKWRRRWQAAEMQGPVATNKMWDTWIRFGDEILQSYRITWNPIGKVSGSSTHETKITQKEFKKKKKLKKTRGLTGENVTKGKFIRTTRNTKSTDNVFRSVWITWISTGRWRSIVIQWTFSGSLCYSALMRCVQHSVDVRRTFDWHLADQWATWADNWKVPRCHCPT